MGELELLEPEHPPAAPREVEGGRGPHPAETDHDRVVPLGHRRSLAEP